MKGKKWAGNSVLSRIWDLSAGLMGFSQINGLMFVWCWKTVGGNFVKRSQPAAINYIITLSLPPPWSRFRSVCLRSGWITKRHKSLSPFFPSLLLTPTLFWLVQLSSCKNWIISSSISKVDAKVPFRKTLGMQLASVRYLLKSLEWKASLFVILNFKTNLSGANSTCMLRRINVTSD